MLRQAQHERIFSERFNFDSVRPELAEGLLMASTRIKKES
jgi:hypothetical protein